MDMETARTHHAFGTDEPVIKRFVPQNLTHEEKAALEYLADQPAIPSLRIEQERIAFEHVKSELEKAIENIY